MNIQANLKKVVDAHSNVFSNIPREEIIQAVVDNREAIVSESGVLATWTPKESTGRSPKDTVLVKRISSEKNVDWNSPNNIAISEETFDLAFNEALEYLKEKEKIYTTDRVIGADSSYALPVKVVTDFALTALFSDNMFRPVPEDISKSIFHEDGFTLLALPYSKLDSSKYVGRLREMPNGSTSNMIVAVDMDRKIGLVVGSAYMGSCKKMLFTVMNYLLPLNGILPLHCSANEGENGDSALLLGLSGTGKTTLSADASRALLGDDEHGWNNNGIANFENGCYAKMIDIDPEKEPDIYDAVMHKDDFLKHGAIVENAMMYPDGEFDYFDDRYTPNSRASYLLSYLKNIKESSTAGHPKTILFLTADAYGVLPPVSKLNADQAMLWFLMGYTSKLAGTETGVTEPQATFSRFFGQPFMPLNPDVYAKMLGEKMEEHKTNVYLINTGWSGGAYGVGKRMDIKLTRKMVNAALSGDLENVEYEIDDLFHVNVPKTCPGVPSEILTAKNTWEDKAAYGKVSEKLAQKFAAAFDKNYGDKNIDKNIIKQCPGK
ncbi:MAG: phosphoenolpyruvate carboxykinase (ATP) [Bacteroidetes bacterium]|jgi:phosphoenolpyruvate carboxykinase (ATP)|nr:phosphoenolpyruvate carboxykinase (ATP) [Bacteroidota bacterium]MBT6687073.1 phosphoenolpyruvate carboxykinase (ATP) [Bacteroidota bacterium]MBT7142824.1 phosphoenolpyruvate carboxykinase (ATP) [Bacteroidota bacterium]MBT7492645.1 phosphoenolpyruvate carboxykinase (ATP) [Bacteroidota bacterium]